MFVGEINGDARVFQDFANALGISESVTFVADFVPEARYRAYLAAADCAVQLRDSGAGDISGALQDCIAAGVPSITNRSLAENLVAPPYVERIADILDPAEIAATMAAVLADKIDTESERGIYCDQHSMARYAGSLLEMLGLESLPL